VTKWLTGALAILVRTEPSAHKMDLPSTALALVGGLARCVMSARFLVRWQQTIREPLCQVSVRMEEAVATLACPTLATVGMASGDPTASTSQMPALPTHALMEQLATT